MKNPVVIPTYPPSYEYPPSDYRNIHGRPSITVSPKGLTLGTSEYLNDGADFGPDSVVGGSPGETGTPKSSTGGWAEAIAYASAGSRLVSSGAGTVDWGGTVLTVKKPLHIDMTGLTISNGAIEVSHVTGDSLHAPSGILENVTLKDSPSAQAALSRVACTFHIIRNVVINTPGGVGFQEASTSESGNAGVSYDNTGSAINVYAAVGDAFQIVTGGEAGGSDGCNNNTYYSIGIENGSAAGLRILGLPGITSPQTAGNQFYGLLTQYGANGVHLSGGQNNTIDGWWTEGNTNDLYIDDVSGLSGNRLRMVYPTTPSPLKVVNNANAFAAALRYPERAGFKAPGTYGAFQVEGVPTAGTGVAQNTNLFPVRVLMTGATSGGVVTDAQTGTTWDTADDSVVLYAGDKIAFGTTSPTSWLWEDLGGDI